MTVKFSMVICLFIPYKYLTMILTMGKEKGDQALRGCRAQQEGGISPSFRVGR
jgi:hypothetical protein